MTRSPVLRQPIVLTATEFAGFIGSLETHLDRWDWPQSTLDYCRFRLHELTAELLAGELGTAVAA